jgi:hypothetical protein
MWRVDGTVVAKHIASRIPKAAQPDVRRSQMRRESKLCTFVAPHHCSSAFTFAQPSAVHL